VSAGFIAEKVEIDAFAPRSKGKQSKKGKATASRNKKWGFVARAKRTDAYARYFDPTPVIEWEAMQLQPEVRLFREVSELI
jgi:hypothetical protein